MNTQERNEWIESLYEEYPSVSKEKVNEIVSKADTFVADTSDTDHPNNIIMNITFLMQALNLESEKIPCSLFQNAIAIASKEKWLS